MPSGSGPRFLARVWSSAPFAAAASSICAPVSATIAGGVTDASERARPDSDRAALRTVIVRPPENTVTPPVGRAVSPSSAVNSQRPSRLSAIPSGSRRPVNGSSTSDPSPLRTSAGWLVVPSGITDTTVAVCRSIVASALFSWSVT